MVVRHCVSSDKEEFFTEILDRVKFVVSDDDLAFDRLGKADVAEIRK